MKNTLIKKQLIPEFKSLKFNSEKEFIEWLTKTTYKKIHFKDNGQDLLIIWIADTGEILHANLQASIWDGKFVNLENMDKNTNIQFWDNLKQQWLTMDFIVDVIN